MIVTVPAALGGERLDRVVALVTGLARAQAAGLVDAGAVRIDRRPVTQRSRRLVAGEELAVEVPAAAPAPAVGPDPSVTVAVVHEDADVLVVDKPAGLVVHPGAGQGDGTLVQGLLAQYPELAGVGEPGRPGIVHRLDKGTSGLLAVARSARAYTHLVGQLRARTVERRYVALVRGTVETDAGLIDAPVGRGRRDPTRMAVSASGRQARTRYRVIVRHTRPTPTTVVECRLETGRTHQIRVHLAAIGHPLVGDARYGGARADLALARPFLHAAHLGFDHPDGTGRHSFDSPLPADLAGALAGLD